MPDSTSEISAVIKALNSHKIPYALRGNGSSVKGFVMSEGAVIDLGRMKSIEFDEKNWVANRYRWDSSSSHEDIYSGQRKNKPCSGGLFYENSSFNN